MTFVPFIVHGGFNYKLETKKQTKTKNKQMKTTKTISKIVSSAILAMTAIAPSFAQTNVGSACGCPAYASRTHVNLSTLADGAGKLTAANQVFTCDKVYHLDKKIYVDTLKTLTIAPGTIIKGDIVSTDPALATALVVTRGGKIYANGTAECPIVFTANADPMDGTYGVSNHGAWGGVVILGKASTNLTLANAPAAFGGTCSGSSCFGTGVGTGYIEGFIAANTENQYGGSDDADNSGVFKYVSLRHAGAVINAANGNELNGLTLGGVGNGTEINHVEIVSSNDDGIEFFGGTVNVKHIAVLFCKDDMFDWDQGWRGNAQFLFGFNSDTVAAPGADNGFEMDNDDQKTGATPISNPVIYNATLIGNKSYNQGVGSADKSAHAAINAKEFTGGEIRNSIFANFETGFNMQQSAGTRASGNEAYYQWNTASLLKVECNSFIANAQDLRLNKSKTSDGIAGSAGDLTKFTTTDNNASAATLAGFDVNLGLNDATNAVTNSYDATPNPSVTSSCTPPTNGFFSVVTYKGAFDSTRENWLAGWSIAELVKFNNVDCPTDTNNDGVTNVTDFLQVLGVYNGTCN